MSILDTIVLEKRKEIEMQKKMQPLGHIRKNLRNRNRDFFRCLKGKNNIIAEVKFKSPSMAAVTGKKFSDIITAYDQYANAISILTDEKFFGGNLSLLTESKKYTKLPILRKDFIVDSYQVYQSCFFGADAILLIVRLLSPDELMEMIHLAESLGMDALVEAHTQQEIKTAIGAGAHIIGINNRDLTSPSLHVDLSITDRLKQFIPPHMLTISESGFDSRHDILHADTNGALVGTCLMRSEDPEKALQKIHRPKVKICGITNKADAQNAIIAGADLLGFNFYSRSPRYIEPKEAAKIIAEMPITVQSVGVFVDQIESEIENIISQTLIDIIQLHGNIQYEKNTRPVISVRKVDNERIITVSGPRGYAVLYDTQSEMIGGTGEPYMRSVLSSEKGKIIIAGGLTAANVDEALQLFPYGVDTASGVEKEPGKKDFNKMKEFIGQVRSYAN